MIQVIPNYPAENSVLVLTLPPQIPQGRLGSTPGF